MVINVFMLICCVGVSLQRRKATRQRCRVVSHRVIAASAGVNSTATQALRHIEARLKGATFQRVHRNALVNVNHVRKMTPLTSQRWLLTLSNGQEFIVSKRQAASVRQLLQW